MSEVMTIRIDRKTKSRLEKLAKTLERTKSFVAAQAIRAYVDLNEWQIAEIKAAVKEADAGDFASEEEVLAVMKKWRQSARRDGRDSARLARRPKMARKVLIEQTRLKKYDLYEGRSP